MDLYVKSLVGSMIIVNVNDMNKLVGCIKMMSLLENVELGVPHGTSKNHRFVEQCQQCKKFGHIIKICIGLGRN